MLLGICIILKFDVSQKHNVHPVLYRVTTSPNSKGKLEGTAEAVAWSDSIKSAVLKDLRQSNIREAKGKRVQDCGRRLARKQMKGSVMSKLRDQHKRNGVGRMGQGKCGSIQQIAIAVLEGSCYYFFFSFCLPPALCSQATS